MKKILNILLLFILSLTIVACNNKTIDQDPKPNEEEKQEEENNDPNLPITDENLGFAIHYDITTKTNGDYTWNLWLWEDTKDGADYQFTETDSYGLVARFSWADFPTAESSGLGFIVKENKPWENSPSKDGDDDRYVDFSVLERDQYGYYNIYLKNGDSNIYINDKGELLEMISHFELGYNTKTGFSIWFQTNREFASYEIKLGNEVLFDSNTPSDMLSSNTGKRVIYELGNELPSLLDDYILNVTFKSGKTLTKMCDKQVIYSSKEFEELYTYSGELGAIYTSEKTTFRVWSPISSKISLRIYDTGTPSSLGGNNNYQEYAMKKIENGVFEYVLNGDNEGKYYTYVVTNSTYSNREVVDPYAKSTGINGLRGMVVDFSKTNPEGWDNINVHNYASTSLTVYETHISDLTSSSTWGGSSENAKKFKGFYETGTTYTSSNGITVSTGFDHIKELGVNAVQLLPIFDQANTENTMVFNWGYNPLNYNTLEGSYSSDPSDGYVRIKEFKELVKAYNEAGINIIMDVVYNHVNGLGGSNFDVLMPGYYFRYSNGSPSNGSGCGNETASERSMYRKFMVDSTEFWASEYKLGGFRFDLMAVHDLETMNELAKNLHENVNEAITVYGEPWTGDTAALSSSMQASQANMNKYEGYGCFNDKMRDALIKGGLNAATSKGWITNNSKVSTSDVKNIKSGLTGLILSTNKTLEVEKCVNYVTCHDNYTLYDRIKAAGIKDETTIKKMAVLANSVVFTSQGISFMLAGEEFLRTKQGNENSYSASYKVNELNYALKIKNSDVFANYQKLIAIKQNSNLFGLDSLSAKELVINTNKDGSMIYYKLTDNSANREYLIIHSNGVSATDKVLDLTGYSIYLNTLPGNIELTNETTISNYQTLILYKDL